MTGVIEWPAYLLKGIPPDTANSLAIRAVKDEMSVNDVIRQALCAKYGLDCEQESRMHVARYYGGDTILIRLQPPLYARIKRDTGNRYGAVRALILDSLTAYLEEAA